MADTFALVTGASSGFGVDFSRELAARGYDLVLVARRVDRLEALASDLRATYPALRVEIVAADLARDDERERVAATVADFGAPVEVLINNAGLGLFGAFESIPWAKEHQMLEVDIAAVVHLCKLIVPGMRARKRGFILNVASIGAFQPTPLYASYSAAKAFVKSFTIALNFELRGSGVSATVVSPGIAATEFLDVSKQQATKYQKATIMSSEAVVRSAVRALFARRSHVVPGPVNLMAALTARFTPDTVSARIAYEVMRSNEPQH
jgi:short-subunit dehydrogenase